MARAAGGCCRRARRPLLRRGRAGPWYEGNPPCTDWRTWATGARFDQVVDPNDGFFEPSMPCLSCAFILLDKVCNDCCMVFMSSEPQSCISDWVTPTCNGCTTVNPVYGSGNSTWEIKICEHALEPVPGAPLCQKSSSHCYEASPTYTAPPTVWPPPPPPEEDLVYPNWYGRAFRDDDSFDPVNGHYKAPFHCDVALEYIRCEPFMINGHDNLEGGPPVDESVHKALSADTFCRADSHYGCKWVKWERLDFNPAASTFGESTSTIPIECNAANSHCAYQCSGGASWITQQYRYKVQICTNPSPGRAELEAAGYTDSTAGLEWGCNGYNPSCIAVHAYAPPPPRPPPSPPPNPPPPSPPPPPPLSSMTSYQRTWKNGVDGISLQAADDIVITPDGKFLYVGCAGAWPNRDDTEVSIFSRDLSTNHLTQLAAVKNGDTLDGEPVDYLYPSPQGISFKMAMSPDGALLYTLGYYVNGGNRRGALTIFTRDATTGLISRHSQFKHGEGGVDYLRTVGYIHATRDGKYVYVRGASDTMLSGTSVYASTFVVFARQGAGLVLSSATLEGGESGATAAGADLFGLNKVETSPAGDKMYGTWVNYHLFVVYNVDTADGTLTLSQTLDKDDIPGLYRAIGVAAAPDGRSVYVVGKNPGVSQGTLNVFDVDQVTSILTHSATFAQDVDEVDGLGFGAEQVVVSPNGLSVYVAGTDFAVFQRNTTTGLINFVSKFMDGEDGVDGLTHPNGLVVSPDSVGVYATSAYKRSVSLLTNTVRFGDTLAAPLHP